MEKMEAKFGILLDCNGDRHHSQMTALLLHCTGPDVQDIFIHLEGPGMT